MSSTAEQDKARRNARLAAWNAYDQKIAVAYRVFWARWAEIDAAREDALLEPRLVLARAQAEAESVLRDEISRIDHLHLSGPSPDVD